MKINQARWNEMVAIHEKSEFYDVASFKAGRIPVKDIEREEPRVAGRYAVQPHTCLSKAPLSTEVSHICTPMWPTGSLKRPSVELTIAASVAYQATSEHAMPSQPPITRRTPVPPAS